MLLRLLPILGITFIDILGFSIMIPLMPFFVKDFHVPDVVVGIVFATFSLCQLIAAPIWGNVSDRIGRKMVLIVSQVGSTIAWGLLALATSIPLVLLSRALEGLSGGNIGVTQAYVGDLVEPKRRSTAFAYVGASFSAGFVFGPAVGGWLSQLYGYRVAFALAAVLQLVTLIVTIFLLPESRGRAPSDAPAPSRASDILRSFADPAVAPVLWLRLLYTLAMYGWFSSMALVLHAQLGWNSAEMSYVFAGFGVLQVVLQLAVVGRVLNALGNRTSTNVGFAFCLVAFALVPFVRSFAPAALLIALFGTGLSLNNAAFPALASEVAADDKRGTVLGVFGGLDSFAGFVMPPIVTWVLGAFGVPPAAGIIAALVALALVFGLLQARGVARAPAAAAAE